MREREKEKNRKNKDTKQYIMIIIKLYFLELEI